MLFESLDQTNVAMLGRLALHGMRVLAAFRSLAQLMTPSFGMTTIQQQCNADGAICFSSQNPGSRQTCTTRRSGRCKLSERTSCGTEMKA
jgi:hypothetical protein